jgi:hypothetical protein
MEQALQLLCAATERQRGQLLREARVAREEGAGGVGGVSKWEESVADEEGEREIEREGEKRGYVREHTTGTPCEAGGGVGRSAAAAQSTWTEVVRFLVHLKLPKV